MIRALCRNQTFMLSALDGSIMYTKPNDVNEIEEKFTTDPTYAMAVAAGALEPIKTDKQAQKKADEGKGKANTPINPPVDTNDKANDAK